MSLLRCPTCGRRFEPHADSSFRPFCSERCRLIDLGAWITEKHRIAGESVGENGDRTDFGHEDAGDSRGASRH